MDNSKYINNTSFIIYNFNDMENSIKFEGQKVSVKASDLLRKFKRSLFGFQKMESQLTCLQKIWKEENQDLKLIIHLILKEAKIPI